MGLYNAIFGENPLGWVLVYLLQAIQPMEVGRYRDAWVERQVDQDLLLIRVHTRNGGGNREDQAEAIESMQAHPWYVSDADDDFDYTYADFYFKPDVANLDPTILDTLATAAIEPVDVGAKWQAAIDAISTKET
jgi:hypothetical protein